MVTTAELNKRNERVEAEKAWEVSYFRRGIITVLTYVLVVVFLILINAPRPFLTAIVPTLGYVLSTLSLGVIKKWWIENRYEK